MTTERGRGAEEGPSRYLGEGLIAYLGNKRRLLPFISGELRRCAAELGIRPVPGARGATAPLLLDPFCGSGAVSRLGRSLGFRLGSNDGEAYAALLARCRVVMDPEDLEAAFAEDGGAAAAFAALDAFASGADAVEAVAALAGASEERRRAWLAALDAAGLQEPYIGRHYAPTTTEAADWRSERLFYSAENGHWLDRAREATARLFPASPLEIGADPEDRSRRRSGGGAAAEELRIADAAAAFLDAILYQAATRTNTSGVFKAFHRGFGGHGRDALSRILSPMAATPPALAYGPPAEVAVGDAASFCASRPADLVYLDPPYNQHQYGSNYHMLTTMTLWDRPPVSESRRPDGYLLDRSGIRADWTRTRSEFCRRGGASTAFSGLLGSIDARVILLSYNDGGIVPLEELAELLSARAGSRGRLRIVSKPYIAYRGGKQSAARLQRTRELLFVLETRGEWGRAAESLAVRKAPASASPGHIPTLRGGAESGVVRSPASAASELGDCRGELRRLAAVGRLEGLLRGRFRPDRAGLAPRGTGFRLEVDELGRGRLVDPSGRNLEDLGLRELESLVAASAACACAGALESYDVVVSALPGLPGRLKPAAARDALSFLSRLAFRKYEDSYAARSRLLRSILASELEGADASSGRRRATASALSRCLERLDALDGRARLRGVAVPSEEPKAASGPDPEQPSSAAAPPVRAAGLGG